MDYTIDKQRLLDEEYDEFDDLFTNDCKDDIEEPKEWTVVTALNRLLGLAHKSKLSDDFWKQSKSPIAFLTDKLGLTEMQVLIVGILTENGDHMSLREMGRYLGCTRVSMMVYSEEIEDLLEKRWISHKEKNEMGRNFDAYAIVRGVETAFRNNKRFVPEKIDGFTLQEFIGRVERHLDKNLDRYNVDFEDIEEWMVRLCKANQHLPLCQHVQKYSNDIHVQALLMMIVYDYAQWADSEGEGLTSSCINQTFPEEYETNYMRTALRDGSHILIRDGYIEHKCEDGMANIERYALTHNSKEKLLGDYKPSRSKCVMNKRAPKNLRNHSDINAKNMFYNATEQKQVERLADMLRQDNLKEIQNRLEGEGLRKGVACIFFGDPGTGKTETVLQIARQTGRDIMQVDIAGMRDKYVGESEKNIKDIFATYRDVCKHSDVMPILFFNEADAIFGKRTKIGGTNPSVEKMDNAMQNIILQEMEDLDGILIATTNLTCNLDSAFERRFLFKIDFQKPDEETKAKLWHSMLKGDISEDEARILAKRYNFSGGQIENITRKRTIDYILSGKKAGFNEIIELCEHEELSKQKDRKPIGFTPCGS